MCVCVCVAIVRRLGPIVVSYCHRRPLKRVSQRASEGQKKIEISNGYSINITIHAKKKNEKEILTVGTRCTRCEKKLREKK